VTTDKPYGPFQHGPNWHYGTWETCEDGTRRILVIMEDAAGDRPAGYVREFPPKPRACTTYAAEDVHGKQIAPVRPTGPSHSLYDLRAWHAKLSRSMQQLTQNGPGPDPEQA
jgi:hypothetical protein